MQGNKIKLFCFFFICVSFFENLQGSDFLMTTHLVNEYQNSPGKIVSSSYNDSIYFKYCERTILSCILSNNDSVVSKVIGNERIEQKIKLIADEDHFVKIKVFASNEAFAAETQGSAQKIFPLVRTSHGPSNNLRNNAVYDRFYDWMLEFPQGTKIRSHRKFDGTTYFEVELNNKNSEVIFRPCYYQRHKNLPYFKPWTYKVCKKSITGWCSWWAYNRNFNQENLIDLLEVMKEKRLDDYGYRFIQIDDVYQGGIDSERVNCEKANGYYGGRPETWLEWKRNLFPRGMTGYTEEVKRYGFVPAVWMGCFFSDEEIVNKNTNWFVKDEMGNPAAAPWVSYVVDVTNNEALETLIRPTFRGLKNAGVKYVKIDQLRHYLYDNIHNNLKWCSNKGIAPDELLRAYLNVAREELGDDTFILACWGVLPELIGIADACRIGGDGYGPITLQQYNSWNGVVWRNDPDHCDILPQKKATEKGNVKKTEKIKSFKNETIIRPALASIAGAMLMLSDKPDVYKNDDNLRGIKCSSPVLFSVPGQLYDFDASKTDWLNKHKRTEITTGKYPSPIDGDQYGKVCQFWLNEFNKGYENWNVLHRLNWVKGEKKNLQPITVRFRQLGMQPSKEYLVYEFWTDKFIGMFKNKFELNELEPFGLQSFAIREKLDRPQIVSTNRHISQGAAEIEMMQWRDCALKGRSLVVADNLYVITIFVPDNFYVKNVTVDEKEISFRQNGNILKLSYLPIETSSIGWKVQFNEMK